MSLKIYTVYDIYIIRVPPYDFCVRDKIKLGLGQNAKCLCKILNIPKVALVDPLNTCKISAKSVYR